uniref:Large ribosomal subunit protein uL23c n=1 Tax=Pseudopediastrum integrum TaxID=271402 RepID=A0A2U8GJJ4_9CHLO|nr:ribosomal protein L23 [Pseudopediastrum integrum]AWI68816.1 ribosomal protein L23 [Pseudopediastrum integrum]
MNQEKNLENLQQTPLSIKDSKVENESFKTKESISKWRDTIQSNLSPEKLKLNFIKYPVRTEKAFTAMFKNQQYTFDVDPRLTKSQIKKLFEDLFQVNIVSINTHIPPRKKVRVGTVQGYRPRLKRAIFTLKKGQSIKFD